MKCEICKLLNVAIELDKHPSLHNFLMFKQLNDSLYKRVTENAEGTIKVCTVHIEVNKAKESLLTAVRLANLKRDEVLAKGRLA